MTCQEREIFVVVFWWATDHGNNGIVLVLVLVVVVEFPGVEDEDEYEDDDEDEDDSESIREPRSFRGCHPPIGTEFALGFGEPVTL